MGDVICGMMGGEQAYRYGRNEAGGWGAWVAVVEDEGEPGKPVALRICEGEVSHLETLPTGRTMAEALQLARTRAEECAEYNRTHPGVEEDR